MTDHIQLVMQSLSILLISISTRQHFEPLYMGSVASVKKLVTWLQYLRENNEMAKRAYRVVYDVVKEPHLADPEVWNDIVDAFPTEIAVPAQEQVEA
jgi:hypothetical protein